MVKDKVFEHPLNGKTVKLISSTDPDLRNRVGSTGIVIGQTLYVMIVKWDFNRMIGLFPGIDKWEVVEEIQ